MRYMWCFIMYCNSVTLATNKTYLVMISGVKKLDQRGRYLIRNIMWVINRWGGGGRSALYLQSKSIRQRWFPFFQMTLVKRQRSRNSNVSNAKRKFVFYFLLRWARLKVIRASSVLGTPGCLCLAPRAVRYLGRGKLSLSIREKNSKGMSFVYSQKWALVIACFFPRQKLFLARKVGRFTREKSQDVPNVFSSSLKVYFISHF